MTEDIDKVAGKIIPEPSAEEVEDALKLQAERRQVTNEQLKHAAENLKQLMETKELQRLGWVMQFGYKLLQWVQLEASGVQGMNELTLMMLIQAQEQAAQAAGFDFDKIVKDFRGKQLPWIDERLRESKARQITRDRRIKQLRQQLRRQDIPLPFHSLQALFGEKGFTHEDSLSLIGGAEGVRLALRLIAIEYQRAGGTVLFLTEDKEPEPVHIAKLSRVGFQWINCCQILARITETLDPFVKAIKKSTGLVVVDSLDRALAKSDLDMPRPARIQRAFAMLKQYQQARGFALVIGVHTDDDTAGVDPMQIYPPILLSCPYVQVRVEKSKLVDWSQNVCIGNDVMPLDELKKKVKGDEKR